MSLGNPNQRNAFDQLTKSLEKLSIYDGKGKTKMLQVSAKSDFERILGDLKIEDVAQKLDELSMKEQQAIEADQLEEAQRFNEEIKELREKEILLKNFIIIEKNQKAFEDLRKFNEKQISEFNNRWENLIYEISEYSKRIEKDLMEQHSLERSRLEEGIAKVQMPQTKFSADLLNEKYKLKQLVKAKKFEEARELKMNIGIREEKETKDWINKFQQQLQKRKELLATQHKNEYQALKTRLEKTINQKLMQRTDEYEKLLQRIQNLQNEMNIKQTLQFAKIQATNSKLLAKYSLNLAELEEKFVDPIDPLPFSKVQTEEKPVEKKSAAAQKAPKTASKQEMATVSEKKEGEEMESKEVSRKKSLNMGESALDKAKSNLKQTAPQKNPKKAPAPVAQNAPPQEIKNLVLEGLELEKHNVKKEKSLSVSGFSENEEISDPEDDEIPIEQLVKNFITK